MVEIKAGELIRLCFFLNLRVNEFKFIATGLDERCISFRTDAQPVDAGGCGDGAICFNANFELELVQGINCGAIELQEGLSTGANDVRSVPSNWPVIGNRGCQGPRGFKLATARSVDTNKLGVAKPANGPFPVLLAAAPQVTTCETQEHGGTSSVRPLALQREIDFLYRVRHRLVNGSLIPASANPLALRRQAGQLIQGGLAPL